jgi:hypothetical protein
VWCYPGYLIGKEIDKRLGQDYYKQELEKLIQDSKIQLTESTAADKAEIEKQLQQAQSLLNALHTLLDSQPSSEALVES